MRIRKNTIPPIVHHIWMSGDPLWPEWEKLRKTWIDKNPKCEFIFWTQKDFEFHKYTDWAKRILDNDSFWELKFDVLTWEVLRLYGGIKTDNDMECLKCFDDLRQYSSFAGRNWYGYSMGVQLVGMSKGNPLAFEIGKAVSTKILSHWRGANGKKIYEYTDVPAYPFLLQCERVLRKEAFNPFGWKILQKKGKPVDNPHKVVADEIKRNNGFPNSYAIHYWGSLFAGGWSEIMKRKQAR